MISHSAGFFVLSSASEKLIEARNAGTFSGNLHLTTLDAYAPYGAEEVFANGLDFSRDWADNY